MKAIISRTSDWDYEVTKEFNTLAELIDFIAQNGRQVVITTPDATRNYKPDWDIGVEIYDSYRE